MSTACPISSAPVLTHAAPSMARAEDVSVERVVRDLEEDIIFARILPRERLVEDTLMARFGAKRHVVRRALTELERMGIVRRTPNKGAAVRDFSIDEVEQIYEMRALLHERAARRMALPANADLVATLSSIHERHVAAAKAGQLRSVYHLNNAFHDTLFGACGNPYLAETITHYAWLAHAIRSYRMGDPALLAQAQAEHAAMIDALRAGDREALVRLCVAHIQPAKTTYLATARTPAAL